MHWNQEGMGVARDGRVEIERPSTAAIRTAGLEGVSALPDADLLANTRRLTCQSNRVLAALLAHLAEVEARGLHRTRACSSLYTYCIYELRMPEDTAYRRVAAARLVKRFPLLFGAVERGELHLTGLLLLGPHLTEANVAGVLERGKFRTKKEILKLVRLLSPLPDVPSRIEPLGSARPAHPFSRPTWSAFVASFCPVRDLQPDERPSSWLPASESTEGDALELGAELGSIETAGPAPRAQDACEPPPAHDDAVVALLLEETASRRAHDDAAVGPAPARGDTAVGPASAHSDTAVGPAPARFDGTGESLSGPQRYKVQFTADEEYVALVEEAKALLAHASPRADLVEIHRRALRALVAALKKRKYAKSTARSEGTAGPGTTSSASPPAAELAPDVSPSPLNEARVVLPSEPAIGAATRSPDAMLDEHPVPHPEQPSSRSAPLPDALPHSGEFTESPRRRGRHVPAAVRRAVVERDGRCCAYVDARGVRCRETSRLELHHREPFARGGPSTPENLSLYCAAHNALAAERDFGHASTIAKRDHPHFTETNADVGGGGARVPLDG